MDRGMAVPAVPVTKSAYQHFQCEKFSTQNTIYTKDAWIWWIKVQIQEKKLGHLIEVYMYMYIN